MAMIEASRFRDLKARVQAECLRRCNIGSVASYGGPDYYFEKEPTGDRRIQTEHYEKITVPLSAINSDRVPALSADRIVDDDELLALEAAVTTFESRSMSDRTQGDCKSSCTGACYTGCSGNCAVGCGSACSGTCSGACDGCTGCSGECTNACRGCMTTCTGTCSGTCKGGCDTTCTVTCGYEGCVGTCLGLCSSGCTTSCQTACGYCGTNCTGVSK